LVEYPSIVVFSVHHILDTNAPDYMFTVTHLFVAECLFLFLYVLQITNRFQKFLEESITYYRQLVEQLQTVYGSVGVILQQESGEGAHPSTQFPGGMVAKAQPQDMRVSVNKCLICLGDLHRHAPRAFG
jgi:Telomerase activating protein Est1